MRLAEEITACTCIPSQKVGLLYHFFFFFLMVKKEKVVEVVMKIAEKERAT